MTKKNIVIIVLVVILLIIGTAIAINKYKNKADENKYDKEIESFEYNYGSYNGGYREYKVYTEEDKTYIIVNGFNGINLKVENEIDEHALTEISDIVKQNKLYKWNGFDKKDNNVSDGESFDIKIKYKDGDEIEAHGYMKFPSNYTKAQDELLKCLKKYYEDNE